MRFIFLILDKFAISDIIVRKVRKTRKEGENLEKDKFLWTVKVSDKGQIALPKQAREVFNINKGDTLILLGDMKRGIAIVKYDDYLDFANEILSKKDKEDK